MFSFIFASENLPFAIAAGVLLGLLTLEVLALTAGFGLGELLDSLVPNSWDLDLNAPDLALEHNYSLGSLLSWLRFKHVPVMVLVVLWLAVFALLGYGLQATLAKLGSPLVSAWLAGVLVLVASLPVLRVVGAVVERFMPRDQSSAVSRQSFVGKVATITVGESKMGAAAEARLHDEYGQAHYVMVEPDELGVTFSAGTPVLLVRCEGAVLKGIASPEHLVV